MEEIIGWLKFFNFPNSKWFKLGLKLHLLHPALLDIEANHRGDAQRCLVECLSQWLATVHCTVQVIATALNEIEENRIAKEITKICNCIKIANMYHYNFLHRY